MSADYSTASRFASIALLSLTLSSSLTPAFAEPAHGAASPCVPTASADIRRTVIETALVHNVPPELALAVAKVESGFRTDALSNKGARGVMQIMPETALGEFGVGAADLWDADTNIRVGVQYLARLHTFYGWRWDAALSHYNGGSLRGSPEDALPHARTADYVAAVRAAERTYRLDPAVQSLIAEVDLGLAELEGGPASLEPYPSRLAATPECLPDSHLRAGGRYSHDRTARHPRYLAEADTYWRDGHRDERLSPSEQLDADIARLRARVRRSIEHY